MFAEGSFKRGKYAFVPPRFGERIGGGAETLMAALAAHLAARGDEVEVFTTCALDNRTWENHFPAGESVEYGVKVRRFPVDPRNLDIWVPLQVRMAEGLRLSLDEQIDWMAHSVNSSALYEHIAAHADGFDAIFFAPYLFGTTFHGALVRPDKSVLIPCLHDENYAYSGVIQSMFKQVSGCLFNAKPEMDLAQSLYGKIKGGEVGMGFDLPDPDEVAALTPYFSEAFPYVLYMGRKETGKNVQVLLDHFVELKDSGRVPVELKLVIAGGGSFADLHRPAALTRKDIVDIEQVSELDKRRLIRHALCLCQPSTNESFSIVIMEAWLLGCPVIVNAGCPVTRYHAISSGGGLYFRDSSDFGLVVQEMLSSATLRMELSQAGFEYVKEFYSWRAVLRRFDTVMGELEGAETPAGAKQGG